MRQILFLALLLSSILTAVTIQFTKSLFTSSANNTNNSFTAAAVFPTPTTTPANHIVINEVSLLGTSPEEWVELFNPTNSPIDINGWSISDNSGSDIISNISNTTQIPSNSYAVILTQNSTVTNIPSSALQIHVSTNDIGSGLNNTGGDRVVLKNGSNSIVDKMSYGNDTTAFIGPPGIPSNGKTISRIPNGKDTDIASDWQTNTNPTIGGTN